MKTKSPVFVALDTTDDKKAEMVARQVAPYCAGIKLGLEFFSAFGPKGVQRLHGLGDAELFLDLKLHDIPNTVAAAVKALVPLKPGFITLHASGGTAMMRAAQASAVETSLALQVKKPVLLAVTILTSLGDADLEDIGFSSSASGNVLRLADLALGAGIEGLVCSGQELEGIRRRFSDKPVIVVPGIRPQGQAMGDQKRTMAPKEALQKGADYLVIGRPITGATDPAAVARQINESL